MHRIPKDLKSNKTTQNKNTQQNTFKLNQIQNTKINNYSSAIKPKTKKIKAPRTQFIKKLLIQKVPIRMNTLNHPKIKI